jgi:predicted short-subunit dehydrogenase-like oxidoreductase (DUF2520 family)
MDDSKRTLALVGPGRAGSTIALALASRGWQVTGVAGRAPDAASTVSIALCLDAPPVLVSQVGEGASLVLIATPDAAIEGAARACAASLEAGALVVHLAGSRGLDVFGALLEQRPDVRVGALHPLQSFPSTSAGLERLPGSFAALAGDPALEALAEDLELRPFRVAESDRAQYHATAVVASNHVVALLGQVERMAHACGVPFEAFEPLVIASVENAFKLRPEGALTGPIARGDLATVQAHLGALDPGERDAYRALAREAARLAGRRDNALDRLLEDLRNAGPLPGNAAPGPSSASGADGADGDRSDGPGR